MPLSDDKLRNVQTRVMHMHMHTVKTIELIEKNADNIFNKNSDQISKAIKEYLEDFIYETKKSGETHPEALIYDKNSKEEYQKAGLYGVQLDIKERHVQDANTKLQKHLKHFEEFDLKLFKKWIKRINHFLRSVVSAVGAGEALIELKDLLSDELDD